jgi:hypothetical protein
MTKAKGIAIAAEFGSGLHRALETYYGAQMSRESREQAKLDFLSYYAPLYAQGGGEASDDKRTVAKGVAILEQYWKHYDVEPFQVIATEVGGAIELRPNLIYTSRIDLIVQWDSPRGIYGFDHKSTSAMDTIVPKPNNQFSGYITTLLEMYENVLGFQVNLIGVFKTEKQKDKYTGQMVPREIFQRVVTSRTPIEVEQWKREVINTVDHINRDIDTGVWSRFDKCKPFRNSMCAYHDLCLCQSIEMQERLIEMGAYVKEPWSAYKDDPVEEVVE